MDTNEIMKAVTEEMKKRGATDEQIAQIEICIQYFGNADFRKKLNDLVFTTTYRRDTK